MFMHTCLPLHVPFIIHVIPLFTLDTVCNAEPATGVDECHCRSGGDVSAGNLEGLWK